MKLNILIGIGFAGLVLLAWPQIQKYRQDQEFRAWQVSEQMRKAKENEKWLDEFCGGLTELNELLVKRGAQPKPFEGRCRDWKPR
jgi:hypothetical protein